jgi:hypothetical protein
LDVIPQNTISLKPHVKGWDEASFWGRAEQHFDLDGGVTESFVPAGRIDRKIEFPLPDEKTKKRIFQIHTSRMTLADDVTLDDLIMAKDDLSGADIKVTQLGGLFSRIMAHQLGKTESFGGVV